MKTRIFTVILFLLLFVGTYFYFMLQDQTIAKGEETKEQSYDEWMDAQNKKLDTRLSFQTQMTLVYIGELDSHVAEGFVMNNITDRTITYNPDSKALYLKRADFVPEQSDNLLILHEVNSLDALIEQKLLKGKDQISYAFDEIKIGQDNEKLPYQINNEERLFLHEQVSVARRNDQGEVEVKFGNQTKVLQPEEKAFFDKTSTKDGKSLRSKIAFVNFGLVDSKNVKYVVGRR